LEKGMSMKKIKGHWDFLVMKGLTTNKKPGMFCARRVGNGFIDFEYNYFKELITLLKIFNNLTT